MTTLFSGLYLAAIVSANLIIAAFGPGATIAVAFVFIGFDLIVRDRLHDLWGSSRTGLVLRMGLLIAAGGALSWLLNRDAGDIALASCVAFTVAAVVDAVVYQLLLRRPFLVRANGSNVPAALADSLIFPTMAFGAFMWPIVLGQFAAKVLGGFVWSLILKKRK